MDLRRHRHLLSGKYVKYTLGQMELGLAVSE